VLLRLELWEAEGGADLIQPSLDAIWEGSRRLDAGGGEGPKQVQAKSPLLSSTMLRSSSL
jgi:hypothetical protein